jgi:beta-barrel assembly-enhancing protease
LRPTFKPRRRPLVQRFLASMLALTCGLSSLATPWAAQAQVALPSLGDAATESLSIGDERRLGQSIIREARRDPDFLDDPVLLDYVQSLWRPLVAAARQRGDIDAELERQLAFEVFLVRDRSVNAFAWPGGYVGIHLALIAITTNADQLASVLAHELSHVSQRHIARSIGNSQRASLVSIASLLLAVLAASRTGNADVVNAAVMGGQGLAIQGQLNFSRDMEREADRIGFGVLASAGFAPAGMSQMFERLGGNAAVADSGAFPYLRTHPLTIDRISEASNRNLLNPAAPPRSTLMHALMQARSRVLMDSSATALARWAGGESSSREPLDHLSARYAGALARLLQGDAKSAEAMALTALNQAQQLPQREPLAERALALLQAQARLASGDAPGSLALLALQTPREPGRTERPVLLARAQAALQWRAAPNAAATDTLTELRRATEDLQTWVAEHNQDALAWELLSSTAQAVGLRLRSMRAGAEARAILGDYTGAIDRLRAAQAATRGANAAGGQDFIEASVIDARLRQLQAERRQIALDARGPQRSPDGERENKDNRDGRPPLR